MTAGTVRMDAFDRYAVLANGHAVHLRPAAPDDAPRVRDFYEHLGDTSTYYRFFGLRRAIPDREVAALVAPELPRHATLLACMGDEIVGVGELHVLDADPTSAEVAFAVTDDLHGQGIATLLLEDLAVVAEQVGVQRLVAETLPGNTAMQLVFRTAGLDERHRFDSGLMDVVMELGDHQGLRHEAVEREATAVVASIGPFFRPRHVAVFGDAGHGTASARRITGALGALFTGRVSVVDPAEKTGRVPLPGSTLTRVRALADLDNVPELAVVAVAPAEVSDVLHECGAAGVRSVLVVSTTPHAVTQQCGSLAELAHQHDLRIIGPCAGIAVPAIGLLATRDPRPFAAGSIAVVTDDDLTSGSLQHEIHRRGLGVSAFVTLGESSDVVTEDLLVWWSRDADTRAVLIDRGRLPLGHRYRRIARTAAALKPLVTVAEPGSGVLVDDDGVIHAVDRVGLVDLGLYFATAIAPRGPRVVGVSSWATSAAETAKMSSLGDGARSTGLVVPVLTASTTAQLRSIAEVAVSDGCVVLPATDRTDGPIRDEGAVADLLVSALLASDEVDACLVCRRGQLVVEIADGGSIIRAPLGLASWQRGLDVLARAWAWQCHADAANASGHMPAPLPDELYVAADGSVEPLR